MVDMSWLEECKPTWCESIQEAYKELLRDAKDAMERLDELDFWATAAEECVQAFPELEPRVIVNPTRSFVSVSGVHLIVDNVLDFDDVSGMLEWLTKRVKEAPGFISDYAEIRRRSWVWGAGHRSSIFRLSAFLSSSPEATCKVVETGETKPVQKFVCYDSLEGVGP